MQSSQGVLVSSASSVLSPRQRGNHLLTSNGDMVPPQLVHCRVTYANVATCAVPVMNLALPAVVLLLSTPLVTPLGVRGRTLRRAANTQTKATALLLYENIDEIETRLLEKGRGGGSPGGRGSSGSSGGSRSSSSRLGLPMAIVMYHYWNDRSSSSSIAPSCGGGRYYGGGSTSAYQAGLRSPSGLAPHAVARAGTAIFPSLWLYGAYAYNFNHPYHFHNASNITDSAYRLVTCLCQQYNACGCDDDGSTSYLDTLLEDGKASSGNDSLIHIGIVSGSRAVIINGTLPNGSDGSLSSESLSQKALERSSCLFVGAILAAMMLLGYQEMVAMWTDALGLAFCFSIVACSQSARSHVFDSMGVLVRGAGVRHREEELFRRAFYCLDIAKSGHSQHSHVMANNLNDPSEQQTLARDRRSMNLLFRVQYISSEAVRRKSLHRIRDERKILVGRTWRIVV